MKILFFSPLFYPHIGGVEKHVAEISKFLEKKGHVITVVTEQYDKELPPKEEKNGSHIVRIPYMKEDKLKKFKIWWWLFRNRNLIKNSDIIHCHDVFFWYLPFRFLYPFKPVFTTFHGYETTFPPSRKAVFIRYLSNALSKGSINIGRYIEMFYGTKPNVVLYGAVDKIKPRAEKKQKKDKVLRILLVGRLEGDIGVKQYLEAVKILKKKGISIRFETVGDGALRENVEKVGKVYGFVEGPEIYIKAADIIFTSSYLSILEALSWRKPVIAVYENPLKEAMLKHAPFSHFITICRTGPEIAKSVMEYEKKLKKKLDDAELDAFLSKITWERVAEAYLKLWGQI